MERFYKKHSKGSSLVFVIIAVAFVGILGSILLNVTLINIETKGTDRDVKKNFYTTESVMDKLNITLENISADAMKDAYVKLLGNYTDEVMNTTEQATIQNSFATNYINAILDSITNNNTQLIDDTLNQKVKTLPDGSLYDIDKISHKLEQDLEDTSLEQYITTQGDPKLEVFFDGNKVDSEKYLLLKNMKVKYYENTDASNADSEISTWITTDIKFSVPILRFEGGGTYPNFTEYSIIGDDEVLTQGSASATIDGSLYAGFNGFNINNLANVTVKRKSANIITRQDINVFQNASLTLGEKENLVNVYAKNYRTSKVVGSNSTQKASLKVYANSYIMDDLDLDAPYSDAYFGGDNAAYYGYSFNKDNTTDTRTVLASEYSSAIQINGKHSSLEMASDMSSILLGGRAYISRVYQNEASLDKNDILMGESLAVKSDQNYYLVSDEYMKEGYTNPMSWSAYDALDGAVGEKEVLSDKVVGRTSGIGRLLKSGTGQGVVPFVYDISSQSGSGAMVYFYYNFKSQAAADTFFNNYCDKDDLKNKIVSNEYLHFGENSISGMGISISPNIALFASSNYMTYTSNGNNPGEFKTYGKTIDTGDEAKLKQESIDYAITYKALQLELSTKNKNIYESTYDGSDPSGTTGFGMSDTQLEGNQIFDSIMAIDRDNNTQHDFVIDGISSNHADLGFQSSGDVKVKAVPVDVDGTYVWAIFVVRDNATPTDSPISLDTTVLGNIHYNDGTSLISYDRMNHAAIVVSNCNISVDTSLRGLVISDNKVYVSNTISLTAEPALLRNMFRKQRATEGTKDVKDKFITYFTAFSGFSAGEGSGASDGAIDISRYITYSNWKKNADENEASS